MFELKEVLSKERSKWVKSVLKNQQVGQLIQSAWDSVFTGQLGVDLKFGYYKNGELCILTQNYCWVQEIKFHEKMIKKKVDQVLGKRYVVRDIKVVLAKESVEKKVLKSDANAVSLSLEDKIKATNRGKRLRGDILCDTCKVFLPKNSQCVFCKLEV